MNSSCHEQVVNIISNFDDVETHYSVYVSVIDLAIFDCNLGNFVLLYPNDALPLINEALVQLQREIKASDEFDEYSDGEVKENIHVRFVDLPADESTLKASLPRASDIGKLIAVQGTVIRTGVVKMLAAQHQFQCTRCHSSVFIQTDIELNYQMVRPIMCSNPDCSSTTFTFLEGGTKFRNYQEIKIQEQIQRLQVGSVPRVFPVILEDDLAEKCKAGDNVFISGTVHRKWKHFFPNDRTDLDLVMQANAVRVLNQQLDDFVCLTTPSFYPSSSLFELQFPEDDSLFDEFWRCHWQNPIAARNEIVAQICPQIYGMYIVKLALLLTLIGGVSRTHSDGTSTRGDSHLLMIGDPGTGLASLPLLPHPLSL